MALDIIRRVLFVAVAANVIGCAAPHPATFDAESLALAMGSRPVVLLGEVHDNAAQHVARADALRKLVAGGARPAIAFEQFDRERQADLDRARAETLPAGVQRVDHVIAQAGAASGWNWALYRPFVQIALDYDLPIVAANLSRAGAMRVAQGKPEVAGDATRSQSALDNIPPDVRRAHELAVERGHCGVLPTAVLPAMANAQMARDMALAQSIRPYMSRGVVLLTGNGHARNDIGVPYWLTASERSRTVTIGLIEYSAEDESSLGPEPFDFTFSTPRQIRDDPCMELRRRFGGG